MQHRQSASTEMVRRGRGRGGNEQRLIHSFAGGHRRRCTSTSANRKITGRMVLMSDRRMVDAQQCSRRREVNRKR